MKESPPPATPQTKQRPRRNRRLRSRSGKIRRWEQSIGSRIPLHPNVISALKLLVVTPLIFLALRQINILADGAELVIALFLAFTLFDYLDGVVARSRDLETQFGRIFDRLTDYPLLLIVAYFCSDVLSIFPLIAKISLDLLLLGLYAFGRGSPENRLRSSLSYTTLLTMLIVSQGWAPALVTPTLVEALLWINAGFSAIAILYNLNIFQKHLIADLLSVCNFVCGGFSIFFASREQFFISLLFLILGAALDGFDGAAARRWGGTKWGVYSDDIADGFNYGIAPGVALYFALGGLEGIVLGSFFALFTISRLIFFTLNKSSTDPNYFRGVPSPVGGFIIVCSIVLFREQPAILGLMVGIAATLMVSFSTHYRHLGRAIPKYKKQAYWGTPVYLLLLAFGALIWGKEGPVTVILGANIAYGFWPTLRDFQRALGQATNKQ